VVALTETLVSTLPTASCWRMIARVPTVIVMSFSTSLVESSFLNGDLIGPGIQVQKREIALGTRLDSRGNPCVLVTHGNVCARDGGSGRIGHCSSRPVAEADCA